MAHKPAQFVDMKTNRKDRTQREFKDKVGSFSWKNQTRQGESELRTISHPRCPMFFVFSIYTLCLNLREECNKYIHIINPVLWSTLDTMHKYSKHLWMNWSTCLNDPGYFCGIHHPNQTTDLRGFFSILMLFWKGLLLYSTGKPRSISLRLSFLGGFSRVDADWGAGNASNRNWPRSQGSQAPDLWIHGHITGSV